MSNFSATESFKHKCAKEVFKSWCDKMCASSEDTWTGFSTDHIYSYSGGDVCISWRPNRDEGAWLEYPIVVNSDFDSINQNWDEIWGGDANFVPTYNDCIKKQLIPTAIVDIVLPHKGSPRYFIEICHTNPVSNEKLEKLKQLGIENLIEIDAEWILSQTHIPSKLKIKRWLL